MSWRTSVAREAARTGESAGTSAAVESPTPAPQDHEAEERALATADACSHPSEFEQCAGAQADVSLVGPFAMADAPDH